jgi:predicted transglutaminase-like cysteine proteinase
MQAAAKRLGPAGEDFVGPLQGLLAALPALAGDAARLQAVNRFFNERVRFATDLAVWGEEDHWASPLETLHKGRGDCEDFAIAKYAALLAAGVTPARMRLVYVRAQIESPGQPPTAQPHMVLAYQAQPGDDPLILDNLRPDVLPATRRPDLIPVFSFGTEGLWHGTGSQSAGDPLRRLSRWRAVWAKLQQEGFL